MEEERRRYSIREKRIATTQDGRIKNFLFVSELTKDVVSTGGQGRTVVSILTPAQLEVIEMTARGRNSVEIGDRRQTTTAAVRDMLRRLRNKFQVQTTQELVNKLDELAIIDQSLKGITLTEHQSVIMRLLASGCNYDYIARYFSISPSTVRSAVNDICAKLEVSSRLEAITRARSMGLVPGYGEPIILTNKQIKAIELIALNRRNEVAYKMKHRLYDLLGVATDQEVVTRAWTLGLLDLSVEVREKRLTLEGIPFIPASKILPRK